MTPADDTGAPIAPAPAAPPAPAPTAAPAPPAPAPEGAAPPAPSPMGQPPTEDIGRTIMMDDSPASFLEGFLADNGLPITPEPPPAAPGAPPVAGPPGAPPVAPPNGQPPGNGAPPAAAPPPTGVDPAMLQRLLSPGPMPVALPPQTAWPTIPQQPAMPPAPQAPQPPQGDPNAITPLMDAPFPIPPNIAAAMNADDPNVRLQAIGSVIAAAVNHAHEATIRHVRENVAPLVAQATYQRVEQSNFARERDTQLFGAFPRLRYAAPQLISNAAAIVVQDELARNPGATLTPEVWRKIGALADAGMTNLAAGAQAPFAPPGAPPAGFPPQPPPAPPQPVWNGYQWVYAPAGGPAPFPAQGPAPAPFIAGQSGMPFGAPPSSAPTPASELEAFMRGDWG